MFYYFYFMEEDVETLVTCQDHTVGIGAQVCQIPTSVRQTCISFGYLHTQIQLTLLKALEPFRLSK